LNVGLGHFHFSWISLATRFSWDLLVHTITNPIPSLPICSVMKWHYCLLLLQLLLAWHSSGSDATAQEEECESEEAQVEVCARDFLIYRNGSLPHTSQELDLFCRENKQKESCLSAHSKKCLSHSANQAITELIRSMAKQNRAICSNKNSRRLISKTSQCINAKQSSDQCYQQFVDNIHGIHQYGQEEKIPVICCSYMSFSGCLQSQVKGCGGDALNAINRLVQSYAGETLNYVCREYKTFSKCDSFKKTIDLSSIKEEIPKSFFSLLVKIYLS